MTRAIVGRIKRRGLRSPLSRWIAVTLTAAATFFGAGIGSASAHHGWTGYDSNTLLILTGVIQEVQYSNPHVMVTLEIPAEPEEDGTIEDPPMLLSVVLAPPSRSEARGMAREKFAVGATATVEGYLHRSNEMELRAERITIDEITVELR